VQDRALGARGNDRLRNPLDPDARAATAAPIVAAERLERVDLVGARVLSEAKEDHALLDHGAIIARRIGVGT
jgi:hypothetical protein